jgi:hypothetical protein
MRDKAGFIAALEVDLAATNCAIPIDGVISSSPNLQTRKFGELRVRAILVQVHVVT